MTEHHHASPLLAWLIVNEIQRPGAYPWNTPTLHEHGGVAHSHLFDAIHYHPNPYSEQYVFLDILPHSEQIMARAWKAARVRAIAGWATLASVVLWPLPFGPIFAPVFIVGFVTWVGMTFFSRALNQPVPPYSQEALARVKERRMAPALPAVAARQRAITNHIALAAVFGLAMLGVQFLGAAVWQSVPPLGAAFVVLSLPLFILTMFHVLKHAMLKDRAVRI